MYSGLTWLTRTLGIPEYSTSLRQDFSAPAPAPASAFALAEKSHLEPRSDSGATLIHFDFRFLDRVNPGTTVLPNLR